VLLFLLLDTTALFCTAVRLKLKLDLGNRCLLPVRRGDSEKRLEHCVPRTKLRELNCGRFLAALVPYRHWRCLDQRRHQSRDWGVSLPYLLAPEGSRRPNACCSAASLHVSQRKGLAPIERGSERGVVGMHFQSVRFAPALACAFNPEEG